jgi:hypothetical protein
MTAKRAAKSGRASSASGRRDFLRQGLVVTGGAIVATLGGSAAADQPTKKATNALQPGAPTSAGYRITAHVREYYAKAGC